MPLYLIFGNLIGRIADFFEAHYKVIVPLLIVAFTYWHIQRLNSEITTWKDAYTEWNQAYKNLKQSYKEASAKQAAINQTKLEQGQFVVKTLTDDNTRQLETIKHETESKLHIAIADNNDLRNKLRDRLRTNTQQDSSPASTTKEPASNEQQCDTATLREQYDTLEQACKITTVDYNTLSLWRDMVCNTYGCE